VLNAVVAILAASKVGQVSGSIGAQMEGPQRLSQFVFEYFTSPQLTSVVPNKATLSGKTTSTDGRSVLLTILSFSPVTSPADVEVLFGNIACGAGTLCNIMTLRSLKVDGANQLQLRVSVPPMSGPGDVAISVKYIRAQRGSWVSKS